LRKIAKGDFLEMVTLDRNTYLLDRRKAILGAPLYWL